ncbi:hypothetical protein MMYC01_210299, partial [Madurella mycetomatis]
DSRIPYMEVLLPVGYYLWPCDDKRHQQQREKLDSVAYTLLYFDDHPHWHGEDIIYVKSKLKLLPDYAEKKALLVKQHKEPSHEERSSAWLPK